MSCALTSYEGLWPQAHPEAVKWPQALIRILRSEGSRHWPSADLLDEDGVDLPE